MRLQVSLCLAASLFVFTPGVSADSVPRQSGYSRLTIDIPDALADDPSFAAFIRDLASHIERGEFRSAETLVAPGFFWERDFGAGFDPRKSAIANFRAAFSLQETQGRHEARIRLKRVLRTSRAERHFARAGVFCLPAAPTPRDVDRIQSALENMGGDTALDVLYAGPEGAKVHATPSRSALPLATIRNEVVPIVWGGDSPPSGETGPGFRRVRLPDGRQGFVSEDDIFFLVDERLCFRKTNGKWRIAGYQGGGD